MKDLQEFLSERELFVIENHPAMSYGKIGEQLGITGNRVAQIKTIRLWFSSPYSPVLLIYTTAEGNMFSSLALT